MYKPIYLLLFIWIFSLSSCRQETTPLEQALVLAGENRAELEKVLNRYSLDPADSLKYRAACFLIENMPFYHYFEGELLDQYLPYYRVLAEQTRETPQALLDSFVNLYGEFNREKLQIRYDILEIDSAYLCHTIEWAFKVREEQPWGKSVPFSDFCEYILPYRIEDEQPAEWREELYKLYNPLLAGLRDSSGASDPLAAARVLMDTLNRRKMRFTGIGPGTPHIGPGASLWTAGSCRDLADFVIYA